MKVAFAVIGALVAAFGAMTWWALESGGVAVIETRAPEGTTRSTHVWYTEPGGKLWLEAGTPENPWYRDVQKNPVVRFEAKGRLGRYTARPVVEASGHARIRSLMREKYGLRDRWVALLFDTSHSVAVELLPARE